MDKNDLISRSATLHAMKMDPAPPFRVVMEMPAIDPEELRPKGKWEWYEEKHGNPIDGVDYDWGYRCSNCAHNLPDDYDDPEYPPEIYYCPNCGAMMEG